MIIEKFKTIEELKEVNYLPNFFENKNNELIKGAEEWEEQRKYIKEMLDFYMFGETPEPPKDVKGELIYTEKIYNEKAIYEKIILTCERGLKIEVELTRPNSTEKFPIVIWNQFQELEKCPIEEEFISEGYGILSFNRNQFAPDNEGVENFDGGNFLKYYSEYKEARNIAIWAWGCSFCASWVEKQDFAEELIVTGFSRGGKVAIRASAYDERFKVCAPVSGGSGGSGCFRYMGGRLGKDIGNCESLGYMLRKDRFWYWYKDTMREFSNGKHFSALGLENKLPFDLHTLKALIAPRGIVCLEGLDDDLSNCYGVQVTWKAAQEAYNLLGKKGMNALAFFEGGHEFTEERWKVILDFCNVTLKNKEQKFSYKRFLDKEKYIPNLNNLFIPKLHYTWGVEDIFK